jgi:hypothetical protein
LPGTWTGFSLLRPKGVWPLLAVATPVRRLRKEAGKSLFSAHHGDAPAHEQPLLRGERRRGLSGASWWRRRAGPRCSPGLRWRAADS